MDYTRLGSTGLTVSRLCLGCMSFGEPHRGADSWTLPLDQSREIITRALDAGVNFFDTANVYSDGTSEEIVGQVLREVARRDEIVISTKVFGSMRPGPNGGGLSRKAIFAELDNSLRRLGVDYLDLYQIHRWDNQTPIEETLEALHDVVKAGKVRYLGASSMWAWQFSKALYIAEQNGLTRFSTMQNYYNLLYREEEREMLPLCSDQSVGVLPWSPLARGRLARDWDVPSERTADDAFGHGLYTETEVTDRKIAETVGRIGAEHGVPRAQIALAWLLRNPVVTAPVIGATKPAHLDEALGALDIVLTNEEVAALEEPYIPHAVVGGLE